MNEIARIFETLDYGPAPEGPEQANAWLDAHDRKFGHFIDGKWTRPGKTFSSDNPATGESLAQISMGSEDDVNAAVKAARAAFKGWSALSGYERGKYLYAIARAVQKHSRLFSVLESMDNGKPIRESRDIDIPLVARHFYHHAGWAQHLSREFPDAVPYGVVGQIIPWNFPLLMLSWKIAPALAAGNTVVLKPAEFTPLSALLFAELAHEAGLPPGVINIVTGDGRTGAAIVEHKGVDKIAFTGSTEVGRILRRQTAGTGKKLSLELGGKSPFIVFEDADLDSAIEGVVDAIWFNQGQVCCAGSRLLVQENIAERFIEKLKWRMDRLRVGNPLNKGIDIGAIVDEKQRETIDFWVKRGIEEGATVYQPDIPMPEQGCFYPPTLLTSVEPSASVVQEEIFGPVLVAMTFRTPAEAVELANNTRYGLAASIWSDDINVAIDIARQLKAGTVWINSTNLFDAASGFGGYRESGFGREGGKEGLFEYVRPVWQERPRPDLSWLSNGKDDKTWGAYVPARPSMPNGRKAKPLSANGLSMPRVDRTPKMYIGGKQVRPDGAYTRMVLNPKGEVIGQVGDGNRKDIRNAVEAAHAAHKAKPGWAMRHGHNRAQILYYIGENLDARFEEFAARISAMTGCSLKAARSEVEASVERLF